MTITHARGGAHQVGGRWYRGQQEVSPPPDSSTAAINAALERWHAKNPGLRGPCDPMVEPGEADPDREWDAER